MNLKKTIATIGMAGFLFYSGNQDINLYLKRHTLVQLNNMQEHFDNVYKVLTIEPQQYYGIDFKKIIGSTAFNFKDKDGKSYYIGTAHIFDNITKVVLVDIKGESLEAKVEKILEDIDVTIFSSNEDSFTSKPIKTISYKELFIGEEAYIASYIDYRAIKKTNISGLIMRNNKVLIILDEIVTKGYSGSPVFVMRDNELRLAGVLNLYDERQLNSGAMPSDYFKEYLK